MNEIEEIKNKIRMSELVGGYLPLRKAGTNFKGLCPFHSEKTPSFTVSDDKGIFHCFGCNEGGDIFTFYQKIEGADFNEALARLAEKAGVKLEKRNGRSSALREKILDINDMAAGFYHAALSEPEGKRALEYLKKRGLSDATISDFRLGYSSGKQLIPDLKKSGFSEAEIIASGIGVKKGSELYDRFAHRLTVPIANQSGRVVGLTARVLDDSLPKYLNSSESEIYKKSMILFGLDKAKESIRTKGYALLVEGNMDVIAAHQAGIKVAVGTSGTALSEDQLTLLVRHTNKIYLALDQDSAGQNAALRVLKLIGKRPLNLFIVYFNGKDPADALTTSVTEFMSAIEHPVYAADFLLDSLFKKYDLKKPEGKKGLMAEISEFLDVFKNGIERSHYRKLIAEKLGVDQGAINLKESQVPGKTQSVVAKKEASSALVTQTRYLIELALADPAARNYIVRNLPSGLIPSQYAPYLAEIKALSDHYSYDKLVSRLGGIEVQEIGRIAIMSELLTGKGVNLLEEAITAVKRFKKMLLGDKKRELLKLIREAEHSQDTKRFKLLEDFQKIISEEQKI